jgi:hypothetical protein
MVPLVARQWAVRAWAFRPPQPLATAAAGPAAGLPLSLAASLLGTPAGGQPLPLPDVDAASVGECLDR